MSKHVPEQGLWRGIPAPERKPKDDASPEGWISQDGGPYVPLSVRSRSRIVTWIWLHTSLSYEWARRLARWLP